MKKSVMVGMVVAQVLKGVLAQEVPAVVQGASLWMDANQATSFVYDTTDTLKIIEWKDARNNGKVMTANGATPIYTVTDSNPKLKQDKVCLWTRTASDEAAQVSVGKQLKALLDLDSSARVGFMSHSDAKSMGRGVKERYIV